MAAGPLFYKDEARGATKDYRMEDLTDLPNPDDLVDTQWACDVCCGPFDTESGTGVIIERPLAVDSPFAKTATLKLCARCAAGVSVAQILTIHERWECEHGVPAGNPCDFCETEWPALVRNCLNVEGEDP